MIYDNYDLIFILDACRYDYFEKLLFNTNLKGNLKMINTGVSTTFQWYQKYWSQKTDFNLITENPQPYHPASGLAYKNFKSDKMFFGETGMEVEPEETIKSLILLDGEKYLVHLIPPHLPYVFGEGKELMDKLDYNITSVYFLVQQWGRQNGFDKIREYYSEQILNMLNLLENNLYKWTDRKILITADHGEIIGEDKQYDHPPNPNRKQQKILYNVPFFEVDVEATLIKKRLKMLGYT